MTITRCLAPVLCAALCVALPGCGGRQKLAPAPGNSLPVAAYGAAEPAAAEELIEPSTQARPERNVELQRRSQRRPEDPFELPPE